MTDHDPVGLYARAAGAAVELAVGVRPDELDLPTPCEAWTVQDLLDHLVGGTRYLRAAVDGDEAEAPLGATPADLAVGVVACLATLARPEVLAKTCRSPLGFEWTVREATAGTFMDILVHTWDLATALGRTCELEGELVDACVAMFLPGMPEMGRAAGIVGPAVEVGEGATAQQRLLAAMGRTP